MVHGRQFAISISDIKAVIEELESGDQVFLTVYNENEDVVESRSTDLLFSTTRPVSHNFQQCRSIRKSGQNSLGDILSYMISNRLTVAMVVAENLYCDSLSSDATEIKIEVGMREFGRFEIISYDEAGLSA